jgi:hypothetical protein
MILRLFHFQALFSGCLILSMLSWYGNTLAASLQLTWSDNSQNEDGFDIERSNGTAGAFSIIATLGSNKTTYIDSNLSNNATYCYRLRAFNSIGGSPYSDKACATIGSSTSTTTTTTTSTQSSVANTVSTNIANGAVLSGSSVIWTAVPSNVPSRVEFFVNGSLGTTELLSPYRFNGDSGYLDTKSLADGSHQLKVRALYADSSTAERTITVTVSNAPKSSSTQSSVANTISTNIADGAVLSGSSVIWTAVPSNVPSRVEFFVNGSLGTTELESPYRFNGDSGYLDTNSLADGSHQLKVRARYADSSIAERTITVTVSNTPTSISKRGGKKDN